MIKVALMCGHGRSTDGTWDCGTSYGGNNEAALMLPITKAAVKYLRSYGVTVISDADTNNNKNMIADVKWANSEKAIIYVSLHCDYYKAPSGTLPLYVSAKGKELATKINNAVMSGMGMKTRGVTKRTDLYELNYTDMPACIFETGSIKADISKLKNDPDKYGKCIAKGICDYLGVKAEAPTVSAPTTPTVSDGKLSVDGKGGKKTVKRLQEFLGCEYTDGIISGQNKDLSRYYPNLTSVEFDGGGSPTVKLLQKWVGANDDGIIGQITVKLLQKKLGVTQDGIAGQNTIKALQKYLNEHDKAEFPTVTTQPTTTASWITNANAWATKIAGEKYHYVKWTDATATHTCPICKGRKYDNHYGWNCIGFAFAVWHHGGKLACKCKNNVVSNAVAEQIYKASDAEALKIARSKIGLTDIKVIRNKNGIPKSEWKAGDICLQFSGSTYKHTFYYMGNGKIADSRGSGSASSQIAVRSYSNYSAKVIFRYTPPSVVATKPTASTSNASKIVAKATDYAWAYGTAKKKYAYKTGSAKASYKTALKKFLGKSNKISQSDCGYFVSTCVRASGVSSSFLALKGTKEAFPSVPSTMKIVHKGKKIPDGLLQAGDIIRYKKTSGQHALMYYGNGKIAEAGRGHQFPAIEKDTKKYNKSNVKFSTLQVIRAK